MSEALDDEKAVHQLEAEIMQAIRDCGSDPATEVQQIVQRKLRHLVAAANNALEYISSEDDQQTIVVRCSMGPL